VTATLSVAAVQARSISVPLGVAVNPVGALGAVVLVDTRRVTDSFAPIDFFESRALPYVVGVNCFDGAPRYAEDEVREALSIPPQVPLMLCDARRRESAKRVLIGVVEHAISELRLELARAR